jgi:hypothetical protein
MFVFAIFLHFLGLMLGAGAGFGSMVVSRQIRKQVGAPTPQLAALRPIFARMGLIGIALLWLSGLWLYVGKYGGAPLGAAFHAKLTVAALLLAVILALNIVGMRARSRGLPPPPWLPALGMTTPVLTLLAVALAAIVFN